MSVAFIGIHAVQYVGQCLSAKMENGYLRVVSYLGCETDTAVDTILRHL